ncbi:MAG: hypothetical protein M1814_004197 [Vezdaea aestivalis]|nr:MAG: hypothetical protein M1814_004197 [Vezdaea aestivalis]
MTTTYLENQQTDVLPTPGFFSAAINADEDHNPFDQSFNDSNECPEPTSTVNATSNAGDEFLQSLADGTFSPLFAFTPNPSTPKSGTTNKSKAMTNSMLSKLNADLAPNQAWNPTFQERALHCDQLKQEPSPPQSARPSSGSMEDSFPGSISRAGQPMTILESISAEVRSALGQITPPSEASMSPRDPQPQTEPSKRRKSRVASQSATEPAPAPKRQRKLSVPVKTQVSEEPEYPEGDVKRNRFLERNRVAASKCRQKKKEWTSNLEGRARELQQEKTQLTLMVSSLKDEMLFLKGELLKHSGCDCHKIRQYLNNEAAHFAANPTQNFKFTEAASPVDPAFSRHSRHTSMSMSDHARSGGEVESPNPSSGQAENDLANLFSSALGR